MDYEFPYNDYGGEEELPEDEAREDLLFELINGIAEDIKGLIEKRESAPETVHSYQFISGPFDGGWCARCHYGLSMGAEIIRSIVNDDGEVIDLIGNMYMPEQMKLRFGDKYASYFCSDSRNRKYVFRGYV